LLGWSDGLFFLWDVQPTTKLPGTNIPVYLHMMFQGMFAIITPALISGAVAERIRFKPYCLFLMAWVTFVYCPLAHMVWAQDWNWSNTLSSLPDLDLSFLAESGKKAVGWLGVMGAQDFAGGTVVHIAAGFSGLAAIIVLRKRLGYPEHAMHPNSMVLTLLGAGLLWFGWFGFNGGSALGSSSQAVSAFAATQAAAAAAGLSWMLAEWLHRGKPTALGLASGIVAGLVAVTPASGFVYPWGGLIIGLVAGVVCYLAVTLKPICKYDDSLDAFGVHGVGGFLGAVLTGIFCYKVVGGESSNDGLVASGGDTAQVLVQLIAAAVSALFAFGASLILVKLVQMLVGFTTDDKAETEGLDRTEHGEVGFDLGPALEVAAASEAAEPRAARVPPNSQKRFSVVVHGVKNGDLMHAWSQLCQPGPSPPSPDFKAIYPFVTTVQGNRFRFRGGDPEEMRQHMQRLFQGTLSNGPVKAHVEN
jgi:ammonium transporter